MGPTWVSRNNTRWRATCSTSTMLHHQLYFCVVAAIVVGLSFTVGCRRRHCHGVCRRCSSMPPRTRYRFEQVSHRQVCTCFPPHRQGSMGASLATSAKRCNEKHGVCPLTAHRVQAKQTKRGHRKRGKGSREKCLSLWATIFIRVGFLVQKSHASVHCMCSTGFAHWACGCRCDTILSLGCALQ